MTEYIVDGAEPNITTLHYRTPNGYEAEKWLVVREPIVRCKDCRFYEKGDSGYWCKKSITLVPEKSGFCAWGERKVVG